MDTEPASSPWRVPPEGPGSFPRTTVSGHRGRVDRDGDDEIGGDVIRWLIFAVAVAVMPIVFSFIQIWSHAEPTDDRVGPAEVSGWDLAVAMREAGPVERVLGRGDLLLIAASIGAGGVGDAFARGRQVTRPKFVAGGLAFLLVMFCSWWYADITSSMSSGDKIQLTRVAWSSIGFFVGSVAVTGSCIVTPTTEA